MNKLKPPFDPAFPFKAFNKPKFNPNHPFKEVGDDFEIKPKAPEVNFDEIVSPEGRNYLAEKFPVLSKALSGQTLPMDSKNALETLKKAVSMGEEAILRGAEPLQAQNAALGEFKRFINTFKTPEPSLEGFE